MTAIADLHRRRLHAFDAHAAAFVDDCMLRAPAGRAIASADLETMMGLARAIETQVRVWSGAVARLDLAATAGLDPARAAAVIVEAVFDEVLTAPAWRVLSAGLDLALEEDPDSRAADQAAA